MLFTAKNGFCAFFWANGNDYDVTVTVYYWRWTHAAHYIGGSPTPAWIDDYGPEMGEFEITVYANDNAYIGDIYGNYTSTDYLQNEDVVWTEDVIYS